MFEGSQHYDRGYFHPLQEAGAALNGSTNADRTNYWEVVPTNALDLALWMESDRMGYLLPALTRRQVRQPARGGAQRAAAELREPPLRPRRHGDRVRAVSAGSSVPLADHRRGGRHPRRQHRRRARVLSALLPSGRTRRSRWPATSTPSTGIALAERVLRARFPAARSPAPVAVTAPEPPPEDITLVLEDRVELPRLYMAWHSPALFADGDAELDLVGEVLSSGKTSRLYRALVYEQRIATEVAASQNSRELGSFFQIVATAAPGRTLAEVERAIAKEIAAPHRSRADRGRARALPRAGGGALPLPAADRRRLRREVGPVERLQHVPRRSRVFRTGPRALSQRRRPSCCGGPRRNGSSPARARRAERRPARPRGAGPHRLASRWRFPDGGRSQPPPGLGPERPFTFPGDPPDDAGERPARLDGRAPPGAARVGARARAGRRLVRSADQPGPRGDYRRHARRGLRRSSRRSTCTRRSGASARNWTSTSATTPPSSA